MTQFTTAESVIGEIDRQIAETEKNPVAVMVGEKEMRLLREKRFRTDIEIPQWIRSLPTKCYMHNIPIDETLEESGIEIVFGA